MNEERSDAESFNRLFDSVLDAYRQLGYPPELVGQWALPRRDAQKLIAVLEQVQPAKVLEIGTFVGLATLLMATELTKLSTDAVIHTVDPNFPLEVELEAMNTKAGLANLTLRHHDIALNAARLLGLDHKIVFHAGGFSTGATFASSKKDPCKTVTIVGPKICQANGPFDLVFIDGLHYTDAVLSDLRLAQRFLRPGGRIVVHDVIGMWGSNVRRAVFQFLAETPNFMFQHGKYTDIFDAIGVLQHLAGVHHESSLDSGSTTSTSLLDQPEFVSNLASIAVTLCAPGSAVYLGRDRGGVLPQLADFGIEHLYQVGRRSVSATDSAGKSFTIKSEPFDFEKVYRPPYRFDLCVSLGESDTLEDSRLHHFIDSCVACSDTILFGATPPGEIGAAGSGSRPLAWWVREFWKRGYRFHDVIRPQLEPMRFAYSFSPIYAVTSSELANLYLIRREPSKRSDASILEQLLVEKDSRIEDLILQAVFSDILIQDTLKKLKAAQDLIAEREPRLLEYERALAARDARSQGQEYRAPRRIGAYSRLLRILARLYGRWQRH
jgi:predicted O-methyltransferase YrrM